MPKTYALILFIFFANCNPSPASITQEHHPDHYATVADIPPPAGFTRMEVSKNSFGQWLRHVSLKKSNEVHLYNGRLKSDQSVQFAVLDISVGDKDLQQCADAVMRLRAEFLHATHQDASISFQSVSGQDISYEEWSHGIRYRLSGNKLVRYSITPNTNDTNKIFQSYLDFVFTYASTISLQRKMKNRPTIEDIQPGDVFVKAGSPGHAMIVTDVASNSKGEKMFMLAQGYMPAQDIHIVKNLIDEQFKCWYPARQVSAVVTPEWEFLPTQLYCWE